MRTGTSLVLIALGAILAFAVQERIDGIDLTMVGYILLGVGALGLVITLILAGQQDNRRDDRRDDRRPPA